jgi:hypothetical protein
MVNVGLVMMKRDVTATICEIWNKCKASARIGLCASANFDKIAVFRPSKL